MIRKNSVKKNLKSNLNNEISEQIEPIPKQIPAPPPNLPAISPKSISSRQANYTTTVSISTSQIQLAAKPGASFQTSIQRIPKDGKQIPISERERESSTEENNVFFDDTSSENTTSLREKQESDTLSREEQSSHRTMVKTKDVKQTTIVVGAHKPMVVEEKKEKDLSLEDVSSEEHFSQRLKKVYKTDTEQPAEPPQPIIPPYDPTRIVISKPKSYVIPVQQVTKIEFKAFDPYSKPEVKTPEKSSPKDSRKGDTNEVKKDITKDKIVVSKDDVQRDHRRGETNETLGTEFSVTTPPFPIQNLDLGKIC
jgi:hypothetical protein